MRRMKYRAQSGFTLIELAIALVIIGLLLGGVLLGQDLIGGGKRSAVISDIGTYKAAVRQFRDTYSHLPGDMPNASRYWPSCDATPANCDGDGDGHVSGAEVLRAWQQLTDSEVIEGSFAGSGAAEIGVNIPASSIDGGGYEFVWSGSAGFAGKRNLFRLSADQGAAMGGGILSGADASVIDDKMDDGLPDRGEVQATSAMGCTDAGPPVSYLHTETGRNCVLVFYAE